MAKITLLLVSIFMAAWSRGATLLVLWSWFVVERFGLSPLDLKSSMGIALLIQLLTTMVPDLGDKDADNEERGVLEQILLMGMYLIIEMGVFLGLGALVHNYV